MSTNNFEARLRRLESIEDIRALIAAYAQGADRGNDVSVMMPLFTDDIVWDGGQRFGRYEGRGAVRDFLRGSGGFIGWTLHYMVSPMIEIGEDGEKARASWYLWEPAEMPEANTRKPEAVWIGGTYEAELLREFEGWKFRRITLNLKLLSSYAKGWAGKPVRD